MAQTTLRPDALAIGERHGQETLFWLEVESGHKKRSRIVANIQRRLRVVSAQIDEPVFFAVLGPNWVTEAIQIGLNVGLNGVEPGKMEIVVREW